MLHAGRIVLYLELGDEVDGVLDGGNGGGFFFWDFSVEFFFDGHDQFNSVKGISTKIINEGGFWDNLIGINTKLLNNDVLNLIGEVTRHEKGGGAYLVGRGRGEGGGASNKGDKDSLEHLDDLFCCRKRGFLQKSEYKRILGFYEKTRKCDGFGVRSVLRYYVGSRVQHHCKAQLAIYAADTSRSTTYALTWDQSMLCNASYL